MQFCRFYFKIRFALLSRTSPKNLVKFDLLLFCKQAQQFFRIIFFFGALPHKGGLQFFQFFFKTFFQYSLKHLLKIWRNSIRYFFTHTNSKFIFIIFLTRKREKFQNFQILDPIFEAESSKKTCHVSKSKKKIRTKKQKLRQSETRAKPYSCRSHASPLNSQFEISSQKM